MGLFGVAGLSRAFSRWWSRFKGGIGAPVGDRGERLAARFLQRQGYRILGRKLRTRIGEVDILAEAPDQRTVVVVEVKSSASRRAGVSGARELQPEVHVDGRKRRRLAFLAGQLARRYGFTDRPIRFDVVGVEFQPGQKPVVRHHVAAFESPV